MFLRLKEKSAKSFTANYFDLGSISDKNKYSVVNALLRNLAVKVRTLVAIGHLQSSHIYAVS